jgi:hypothetical protein
MSAPDAPCVCPACERGSVTTLARELWQPGQRVAWCYHAPGNPPAYGAGVIISREDPAFVTAGILIKPDNPLTETFFTWDFAIERGIGYSSPIFAEGAWTL